MEQCKNRVGEGEEGEGERIKHYDCVYLWNVKPCIAPEGIQHLLDEEDGHFLCVVHQAVLPKLLVGVA